MLDTFFDYDEFGYRKGDLFFPAPEVVRPKIFTLVRFGVGRVRRYFDTAVIVTSGWRSIEHNREIGGSKTSQHIDGEACDFIMGTGVSTWEVYQWLEKWWPGQVFHYLQKGHIHLGLPRENLNPNRGIINV